MARRQQVYTARVKRADDGAQDAKIKKKRTGEPEDGALPAKTRLRREAAAPEKDAAVRRATKTAAARLEADDAPKKRTAAKAPAGKPVTKAAKSAPRRRQSDSPAARRRAKEKARVSAMGRDRNRQLARGGGVVVWLIALLTAAFDVLGLLLCAVRTQGVIDTQALVMLAVMAPLALLTATVLPLAFGEWNYGAKNWVSLPVIGSFQPSELVKLALVLAMAYYFSAHRTVWQMMPALVFAATCLVLLMLQRDLGTALIYYLTTLALFYVACGNLPLTAVGLGGGVAAAVLGYRMFAHVKVRVAMWQNPWSDALDKGYQIIQALLAIGSGGLFGVGLGQGTPEKIPAYYNDFIFAVVCEQLGIVFGICVIAVYVLLLLRGMEVSMRARRSFDMLLGCGVVALLGVQTFMIVAGVIKMIPLTGVTMPFLSYGGSSLLSCMAMMGMLCGISGRVREETEEDILSVKG